MGDVTTQRESHALSLPSRPAKVAPATRSALRAEITELYVRSEGRDIRPDTLDALEPILLWLRRCEAHEGRTFLRSIHQAVKGIGWATTGNAKRDHARFGNSLKRRLGMLERMGVVESWEPVLRANGSGRGILVTLRRDSSAGQAHRIRRRRGSCTGEVSPPFVPQERTATAGARAGARRRHPHRLTRQAVLALRSRPSDEDGAAVVAALPWLADLEPAELLRAAGAVFPDRPSSGLPRSFTLAMSQPSRLAAEEAWAALGGAAATAAVIDLYAGRWRTHVPRRGRPCKFVAPRTPGLIARYLRREARAACAAAERRRRTVNGVDDLYAAAWSEPAPDPELEWS